MKIEPKGKRIDLNTKRPRVIWHRNSPTLDYCGSCGKQKRRTLYQLTKNCYIAYLDSSPRCSCGGNWHRVVMHR